MVKGAGARDSPIYAGERVALLTQHGKERVIGPVLEPALGCRIECVTGYDTDLLGTFTREIPRVGTQLEAARKKALLGMGLVGLPLGLASEGSFGPGSFLGVFALNVELLIWIDQERGLEVVGSAQGKADFFHVLTADWPQAQAQAQAFALRCGFPEQQLVVRPTGENDPRIRKAISTGAALEAAFFWARQLSQGGQVFLETDMRASSNPTRMENIRLAAEDLLGKLSSLCPSCGAPGFWIVERLAGVPCLECGAATRDIRADIHGCLKCAHRFTQERDWHPADAGRCDHCNP